MEGADIRISVFHVAVVDRIQNAVRHLVRHDVWTETGEYQATRVVRADQLIGGAEISEQDCDAIRVVVGVCIAQCMWVNAQAAHIRGAVSRAARVAPLLHPDDLAPQCALEVADGLHCHRVHELLMKLRIAFAGREPLL